MDRCNHDLSLRHYLVERALVFEWHEDIPLLIEPPCLEKMMTRRVILSLTLVATIATAALAVGPGAGPASQLVGQLSNTPLRRVVSGCLGRFFTLRSDLNVTDQQRDQIRELLKSRRSEIATTVKSVRDARVALRDLARSEDADQAEIQAAADALGQSVSKAAFGAVKLRGQIAQVLTVEQRAMIDEFLSENDQAIDAFLTTSMAERS